MLCFSSSFQCRRILISLKYLEYWRRFWPLLLNFGNTSYYATISYPLNGSREYGVCGRNSKRCGALSRLWACAASIRISNTIEYWCTPLKHSSDIFRLSARSTLFTIIQNHFLRFWIHSFATASLRRLLGSYGLSEIEHTANFAHRRESTTFLTHQATFSYEP